MRLLNSLGLLLLIYSVSASSLTATEELIAVQVDSLRTTFSLADLNGDGALAGSEFGEMAILLQADPIVRGGLAGPVRRAGTRTVDDILFFDTDGDGAVPLADVDLGEEWAESLIPWDSNTNGILDVDELAQLDGLIQFQGFTNGAGGSSQGLDAALGVIENMYLEAASRASLLEAVEAESKRIDTFQLEVNLRFMTEVEIMLGPEQYSTFVDLFSETLITRPETLNPLAFARSQRTFRSHVMGYDTNGDSQVSGAEVEILLTDLAVIRIELAPVEEGLVFWQRNLNWLDYDGDRQLVPSDIPFMVEEVFSRFDRNADELIDTEEFIAMRNDRFEQYMRREVPFLRYGYHTMVPVLEQMGVWEDYEDEWNQMLVAHEQRFTSARSKSRQILVSEMEGVLEADGLQDFREGFGID